MFNKINNSECFIELWVVLSSLWLACNRSKEFVGGGEGGCCVSGLFSVKFNPQLLWREGKRERKKGTEQENKSQKVKIIFL